MGSLSFLLATTSLLHLGIIPGLALWKCDATKSLHYSNFPLYHGVANISVVSDIFFAPRIMSILVIVSVVVFQYYGVAFNGLGYHDHASEEPKVLLELCFIGSFRSPPPCFYLSSCGSSGTATESQLQDNATDRVYMEPRATSSRSFLMCFDPGIQGSVSQNDNGSPYCWSDDGW